MPRIDLLHWIDAKGRVETCSVIWAGGGETNLAANKDVLSDAFVSLGFEASVPLPDLFKLEDESAGFSVSGAIYPNNNGGRNDLIASVIAQGRDE